jgi:hypothetical protein
MRKKIISSLMTLTLVFVFFIKLSPYSYVDASALPNHKITICHSTNADNNPYRVNTVDKSSTDAEGHNGHTGPIWYKGIDEKWGDIIPRYEILECERVNGDLQCKGTGKYYPGLNWTSEGQAILRNGCQIVDDYIQCSETIAKYGNWSDWTINPEDETQEIRTRIVRYFDSREEDVRCGRETETETRYAVCSRTVRVFGEWSEWMDDETDKTREYRERVVYIRDSQDHEKDCARSVIQTEDRYKDCSSTVRSYGVWSQWGIDEEDETQELRTREVTAVDSQNSELICAGPVIQTEYRDIEIEYEVCTYTTDIYGEWSAWEIDPNDDTREYRQRTVTTVDSEDSETLCGEPVIEKEYRDIEEEGDILGVTDEQTGEGDVLGTTVIYAQTAGEENLVVYLIEFILVISTCSLMNVLVKKQLKI